MHFVGQAFFHQLHPMILRYFSIAFLFCLFFSCQQKPGEYICPPCDLACDSLTFQQAGICPHCQMELIHQDELVDLTQLVPNDIQIDKGSGVFLLEGGTGREDKTIQVYYHAPESFSANSRILIVVPGAGRNGDSYRDTWIDASERHDVLVLSPMYLEEDYPFEEYHLCGLIQEINLRESVEFIDGTNIAQLDEEQFSFRVNDQPASWLFPDFDRLFDQVVEATGSTQTTYDIFGHSAGGQILHRLALCDPDSKAKRILAGNSGFYTLPDPDTKLPFGTQQLNFTDEHLQQAFRQQLVLFIGELDNADEQGGTLLRSPTADLQGLHRLSRGQYAFQYAQGQANSLGADFNWELVIVPEVGHDQEKMGQAAAVYLYGE